MHWYNTYVIVLCIFKKEDYTFVCMSICTQSKGYIWLSFLFSSLKVGCQAKTKVIAKRDPSRLKITIAMHEHTRVIKYIKRWVKLTVKCTIWLGCCLNQIIVVKCSPTLTLFSTEWYLVSYYFTILLTPHFEWIYYRWKVNQYAIYIIPLQCF